MQVYSFNPSCIFNDFIGYLITVVSGIALSAENAYDFAHDFKQLYSNSLLSGTELINLFLVPGGEPCLPLNSS